MHLTQGPPIPDYPIKLAVIGAPFSGKTTVARQLAEALGLKVLSPVSVMDEAIRAAQAVDDARENEMAAWRKACAEVGGPPLPWSMTGFS